MNGKERLRYDRRLYALAVTGVGGIVLAALAGVWLLWSGTSYFGALVCLFGMVLIAGALVTLMQATNRQVALFFDAVRNNDFNQRYPETSAGAFAARLYADMNRITSLFAANRRELEEKRLYYESIIRVLTHEIRNSITPISSLSADLLAHAGEVSVAETKDGLSVIHAQAQNLSAFLDSYHRLTHLPDPEPEAVEVGPLFRKLARLLCAEPGHDGVSYTVPGALTLQADTNLLVLALINLIRNALQAVAGQSGGQVCVEASLSPSGPSITVTDNGPGIPPEWQETIFTPFFSTKEGGSGIGLSLSRRIMQLHGGGLTVHSTPGLRTVFTLHFRM